MSGRRVVVIGASLWHAWIQGSLESGLQAARAITAEIA
jgi:monoamine oxidase